MIDRCVEQLRHWGCDGVVAAARAVDTIKEADAGGRVIATLERSRLWAIQTPQVFRAEALANGARRGDLGRAYDDAQLVEAVGGDVRIVEAPRQNLKVTTPHDLRVAELLLEERARQLMLTDYHTHLRPDVADTPPREVLHRGQRAALPRGRAGARASRSSGFSEHVYRFREASRSGSTRSGARARSTRSTTTSSS